MSIVIKIVLLGWLYIFAITDLKKKSIPVWMIIIFGITGVLGLLDIGTSFVPNILLYVSPGLVLLLFSLLFKGKLGLADALIITILGLYIRWPDILPCILISLLWSSLVSIVLLMRRKWTRDTEIPFLPYLLLGYVTYLFFA